MTRRLWVALAVSVLLTSSALAQEAVMDEGRVAAAFSSGLELQRSTAVEELLKRLELRDAEKREAELHEANKHGATKVLDLMKLPAWLPLGLGASESRVDSFFQQNYMRADLNPKKENPLFVAD